MAKTHILLLTMIVISFMSLGKSQTNTDQYPILLFGETATQTESKDIPISASIDGHALNIYINENVGIAHIVVTNSNGIYIDRDNILHTPDAATILIDDDGFYTVTITLNNGDVYYGDFMVTE
ncbi:MAG: DUF3244 domain-containing protein [Bacteroidales bacterium]|nr:DUF3244 domain-containing protein [Bacteroidales bacterium]